MVTHSNELQIPPAAASEREAFEILRIWVGGGQQHVSVNPRVWDDPAAWGMMLVDLARHIAGAYQQIDRMKSAAALERIKLGFDAEWNSPTDNPSGSLLT
jgi:hypothetical protein